MSQPTSEQIAQMRQFSGENGIVMDKLPYISFNGKIGEETSGKFTIKSKDGNVQMLGESIEGVIVKVRSQGQTGLDSKNFEFITDEYDGRNDVINLLDKKDGFKSVGTGTFKELKEGLKSKNINLKFSHILYVYSPTQKQVYKISVGGGSVQGLWDYLGSFGGDDTVFRYRTKFSGIIKESDQGLKYHGMAFEKIKEYEDWNAIWGQVQSLNNLLKTSPSKKAELLKEGGQPEVKEELPVIQTEEELPPSEDDIKVEDIPF